MSEFKLTPAQEIAVNLRGHTMLVSAAAGSGKTAVLTKRIIELVTDVNDPVDVSELLVVTFTRAAASELRERISKAVFTALKESPSNKHLSNQLLKLGQAKICTIHSFCADLIKTNFQRLGLPANLRIADESEALLISSNVMNDLLDECYGGLHSDKITDFGGFTENFLQAKKDDTLPAVFSGIYNYMRNFPLGLEVLKNCSEELEQSADLSPFESKWGIKVLEHLKRTFSYYYDQYESACDYFEGIEYLAKANEGFFNEIRFCHEVCKAVESKDFQTIKTVLLSGEKTPRLGQVRKEEYKNNAENSYYRSMRTKFWKEVEAVQSKYFCFSEETIKDHCLRTAEVCRNMYAFLTMFDLRFKEEKKERGLLDYSDLENYSIDLLYDDKERTVLSSLASQIKDKYRYVFIDEYQDVNELQDKIFSAISSDTNRFMVGDMKQSIYGFRGSEPALFADYRNKFPGIDVENKTIPDSQGVTLFLSNNFRSDKGVIDFSNAVFKVLFNNNSGKAPYTDEDALVCSKKVEADDPQYDTKVIFVKNEDGRKGAECEAEYVAEQIDNLVKAGKDPSEIALLFRSMKNAFYFEEALKKRNIASFSQVERDFLENDAVLLMLCILNTVDNPSRDIYLAGALKSPVFGFSLSELTRIRRFSRRGSLFDSLKKYYTETNDIKCRYFLNKLSEWRRFAEGCPVDKLIRHIYNDTGIVELLSGKKNKDSDVERQANLMLLYDYARQFENGSFKGLYNFILYLNDVLDKKTKLGNAKLTGEGKGVVNIMTVHHSKGLEFDTVFFCDTGVNFNRIDERAIAIKHKELGLTLRLRDETSFGKMNTFLRGASEIAIHEDGLEDEMRVLYVALTRAKMRLFITSSIEKSRDLEKEISLQANKVCRHVLLSARNPCELILWGILKSGYRNFEILHDQSVSQAEAPSYDIPVEKAPDNELISEYARVIEERLSFEYPYKEFANMPSKLAVSKLYPDILDEYTADGQDVAPSMYVSPRFLLPEQQRATGADRGTATHVFMQFCDFEKTAKYGVVAEIDRLLKKGFIDKRSAEIVNVEKVNKFFGGELYESISKAKKIWREKRFNILLPASEFTSKDELKQVFSEKGILVQGVIDVVFVDENDRLVLADYKTDSFSEKDIKSGEAERILIERHQTQLKYYAEACKRIFGRPIDKVVIYSFALGRSVEL